MKLTNDEIIVENMMAELTNEITTVYVDRTFITASGYSARIPNYILDQKVRSISYEGDGVLSIITKTDNVYKIAAKGLNSGSPEYVGERSINVSDYDTQEIIYED